MSGLLFIRHAETDMAGTFCGHSDPPINSCGRAQITDLLARLVPETFEAIYASDLRRAVNTAEALAETFGVPVTTTPGLREIHFGDWEGLTWAEIEQRDAVYALRWTEAFPALPAPNGETFSAFELRVLQEVENLVRLAESKRIAVVTHGGVMRVVLRTFLGYSEQQASELTKPYCSSFACAAGGACQGVSR
jgi:broad specificity phosphatase PhoE